MNDGIVIQLKRIESRELEREIIGESFEVDGKNFVNEGLLK